MKSILIGSFLIFACTIPVSAQTLIDINTSHRCIHQGQEIESELFKFPATATVTSIVNKILRVTKKRQNFELVETNVENVVAVVDGKKRYLLYNPNFIHRITSKWEAYAVIAHAIGHHVHEHTLVQKNGQVLEHEELAADYFTGYTLGLFGAAIPNLDQVSSYNTISNKLRREQAVWGLRTVENRLKLESSLEYFTDDSGDFKPPIPTFEMPPPKPSAKYVLDEVFDECQNLGEVDRKLSKALTRNGYHDKSYFYVPDGFVLVTRLEQINKDASSKAEPYRWQLRISSKEGFSLGGYLRALFTAPAGYFRIVAFVVTPNAFAPSSKKIDRAEALDWLGDGANALPHDLSQQAFTENYKVTAMIYEFIARGTKAEPSLTKQSNHTGRKHLEQAKLWESLKY